MAGRIVTPFSARCTTTVNDIEHIVANSYKRIGIIKIFFQPRQYPDRQRAGHRDFADTAKQMPPGAMRR